MSAAGPSGQNPYSSYISSDYSIAAVRINYNAVDDFESEAVVNELLAIEAEDAPPGGATVTLTGGPVTSVVLLNQVGPTFAITGILSFVGIFIVVVLIFYSLRYGITSLLAVVFGSVWTFGFLGFTGFALNPNTSGALSLILGIGIDFGIQVVSRFRQELRAVKARRAIARTMPRVIVPMTISVVAIILGFKALSLGNLQFVGELGDIMALGVFMSYLAAITVIPATLVVLNTFSLKRLRGGNSL
jgi:predicted RND superfamily exporter protein